MKLDQKNLGSFLLMCIIEYMNHFIDYRAGANVCCVYLGELNNLMLQNKFFDNFYNFLKFQ